MTSYKVWRITGSAQPNYLWLLAAIGAVVVAIAGGNWSHASGDPVQESTDSQLQPTFANVCWWPLAASHFDDILMI